jgi:hypothetical protein
MAMLDPELSSRVDRLSSMKDPSLRRPVVTVEDHTSGQPA